MADPSVEHLGNASNSAAWGDFDNDGDPDLFLSGFPRSTLLENIGDGRFRYFFSAGFLSPDVSGAGVSWVDLDNDGWLDLVTVGRVGTSVLRNLGNENGWVSITLVGAMRRDSASTEGQLATRSNRDGVGAKVTVVANVGGESVTQIQEVSVGNGQQISSPKRVHFGLGDAAQIDRLSIEWPSGIQQEILEVRPNQHLVISEPEMSVMMNPLGRQFDPGTLIRMNASDNGETSAPPYQWLRNNEPLDLNSSGELVIDDFQIENVGRYRAFREVELTLGDHVYRSTVFGPLIELGIFGFPEIHQEPHSVSISLGDSVTFDLETSGVRPLLYEWFHGDTQILSEETDEFEVSLTLSDVGTAETGTYFVKVSNDRGEVMSERWEVTVDTTFRLSKFRFDDDLGGGAEALNKEIRHPHWGDLDGDNDMDLLVLPGLARLDGFALINDGVGGLDAVRLDGIGGAGAPIRGGLGDMDNDGDLDLFLGESNATDLFPPGLFSNDGSGVFTRVDSELTSELLAASGGAWLDLNRDGLLDLFTPAAFTGIEETGRGFSSVSDTLWLSEGGNRFREQGFEVEGQKNLSSTAAWIDFDHDGVLDVYLARGGIGALFRGKRMAVLPEWSPK